MLFRRALQLRKCTNPPSNGIFATVRKSARSASNIKLGEPITIETEVTNAGDAGGDVVAQLYIHQRYGSASRPIRELKGFQRINLEPHETKIVRFELTPQDLSYWNTTSRGWIQEATTFDYWVGEDSTAILSGTFNVTP